jgi:hypothetical protein
MKTKACILSFLMTFFVVSSLSAADTFSYNGIQYMKTPDYGSNTVAVIQGTYSGDIVVPNWATDQSDQSVYEVVAVYQYAFYSCTNLTTVTLGDSIQYIYPNAFAYSAQLTSVNFPSKLVSIGNNAFSNCTALQSVSIPNSMTSLGSAVFSSCTSLDNITVGSLNPLYASNNGLLYNKSVENLLQCPAGKMGEIILPTSVQRISSEAFKGCSKITSVTIPDGVELIPNNAFLNCTSLSTISLGDGLESIDSYAFKNCSTLMFVNLPDLVYAIGDNAFENCTSLDNVDFSPALTTIGQKCFLNCSNLNSFSLPTLVSRIGVEAFKGCSDLREVALSDSLKILGQYAFIGCPNLTSIHVSTLNNYFSSKEGVLYTKGLIDLVCCPAGKTGAMVIPETVRTLQGKSFYECVALTSVTIPASIDPIGFGGYVFYGCTGLLSIHAKREVPVDLFSATQTFGQVSKSSCTLYVPVGSLTTYSNAYQWKDFFHIVEESTSNLSETATSSMQVQVDGSLLTVSHLRIGQVIRVYNSNGICLFTNTAHDSSLNFQLPTLGLYLVSDGSQTLKVSGN